MNISYLLYEAERPRTAVERREADARTGELAAALARLGRSVRHALTGNTGTERAARRPAGTTVSCALPPPR